MTTSSEVTGTPMELSLDQERAQNLAADDIVIFYEKQHLMQLKKERLKERNEKLNVTYKGNLFRQKLDEYLFKNMQRKDEKESQCLYSTIRDKRNQII